MQGCRIPKRSLTTSAGRLPGLFSLCIYPCAVGFAMCLCSTPVENSRQTLCDQVAASVHRGVLV